MTSTFDDLAGIFYNYEKFNDTIKKLVRVMIHNCIEEINTREPERWTLEKFKTKGMGTIYKGDELNFQFINYTHDSLDHTEKWHLKVFSNKVLVLIEWVKLNIDIAFGQRKEYEKEYFHPLKELKKFYPEFFEFGSKKLRPLDDAVNSLLKTIELKS